MLTFLKIIMAAMLLLMIIFIAPFAFGETPRGSVAETLYEGGYFALGTISALYLIMVAGKFSQRTFVFLFILHTVLFAIPLLGLILAVIFGILPVC